MVNASSISTYSSKPLVVDRLDPLNWLKTSHLLNNTTPSKNIVNLECANELDYWTIAHLVNHELVDCLLALVMNLLPLPQLVWTSSRLRWRSWKNSHIRTLSHLSKSLIPIQIVSSLVCFPSHLTCYIFCTDTLNLCLISTRTLSLWTSHVPTFASSQRSRSS